MLHASISVTLPAVLPEPSAEVVAELDRAFATLDPDSRDEAREDGVLANLSVFATLLLAFSDAGFDDVLSVVVDGKVTYLDAEGNIGDFNEAVLGTIRCGSVRDGFRVIRTTFRATHDDLLLLGELRFHARGPAGFEGVQIKISARPLAADTVPDEGPREYAARVRAYVRDSATLQAHLDEVEAAVGRVRAAVTKRISAESTATPPKVRIIALGERQVARLRYLEFGVAGEPTPYCSLPAYERLGPYDDPLSDHYHSPFGNLFHWIALGEILEGQWSRPDVEVLHPTGRQLFVATRAAGFDRALLDVARNVLRVSSKGALVVDASIPVVAPLRAAAQGGPHSPGWAGEQWADDIADG